MIDWYAVWIGWCVGATIGLYYYTRAVRKRQNKDFEILQMAIDTLKVNTDVMEQHQQHWDYLRSVSDQQQEEIRQLMRRQKVLEVILQDVDNLKFRVSQLEEEFDEED